MKKTIYNIFSLLSMAAVLFAGVACEQENPLDNDKTSDFPELVENHDVVPGTELTITIQPKASWSISINKDSYAWFKIKDGKFDKQTLSGVSLSEPKEITIWTTSEESFDLRSCEVTMKVKGESKVIAKYTLRAKAKTIEAYKAAVTEDGKFSFAEEGYLYEQTPMSAEDEIELVWDDNDNRYYFPVKIAANYDWTVEWPSWARADINVDSKVGETCFDIYGIPSELPLEDAEGEISFKDGEKVVKTFKVRIPGCRDVFTYSLGEYYSLNFDHAQYFRYGEGSFTKEPVEGYIFGPQGARVIVLEMTENGYVVPQTPWLNVELTAWDSAQGADVLQKRKVSISAPRYAGKSDRQALILFLSATAPEDISQILAEGSMGIREEYASYAVSVEQTACPDEYITFEVDEAERQEYGLFFEKSDAELLPEKNFVYAAGAQTWNYNLKYTLEVSGTKSAFYITFPYETVEVYDAGKNMTAVYDNEGNNIASGSTDGGEDATDSPVNWLKYSSLSVGGGLYGQIVMDMDEFTKNKPSEIDGYIVFKDETAKVLAVVHCFYVAEVKTDADVLEDVSETMFVNPDAAAVDGASIYKVVSGPTYESWKSSTMNIYKLIYTKSGVSTDINTSKTVFQYLVPGDAAMAGPKMVTIDDDVFAESIGYLLEWDDNAPVYSQNGLITGYGAYVGEYDGVTSVRMEYEESYTETIQLFSSNSEILYILICELKLN